MKQELTAKENKFCELIAQGKSQVDAYITAYGKGNSSNNTIKTNAYRLMNKQNIINRLAELKEKTEKELKYTKEQQYNELCLLQEQARKDGNLQAELKAIELKGKLFDLYNNKLSIKADIKAKATIKEQRLNEFRIIYTIDRELIEELKAGNTKNETVKMILADLKRTDTAIIASDTAETIQNQERAEFGEVRTQAIDAQLNEETNSPTTNIVFSAKTKGL